MSVWQDEPTAVVQRKKPGRPQAMARRTRLFVIRTTEQEAESIMASAIRVRLPVAIFLRRRGLGQTITAPPPVMDVQVIAALSAIGNNLNQAVRLIHEGRAPEWPVQCLEELRGLCTQLAAKVADRST